MTLNTLIIYAGRVYISFSNISITAYCHLCLRMQLQWGGWKKNSNYDLCFIVSFYLRPKHFWLKCNPLHVLILRKQDLKILYLVQIAGMSESSYSTSCPTEQRVNDLETWSVVQGAFSTLNNEEFLQTTMTQSCNSCCNVMNQLVQDILWKM